MNTNMFVSYKLHGPKITTVFKVTNIIANYDNLFGCNFSFESNTKNYK